VRHDATGRIGALLAGLLFALLLAEIAVRVFDVSPKPIDPLPIPTFQLSDDPVIRYEYRRGYRKDQPGYGSGHYGFETNSEGFRDREWTVAKPPGTRRVIVLGDSITAGSKVSDVDDVYPRVLERLLDASDPNFDWEVMNMGVGGYHTLQEVETLRVRGLRYSPDYVLVGFAINDFNPNADGMVYQMLLFSNPDIDPEQIDRSLLGRILEKTRLGYVVYHRLSLLFGPDRSGASYADRFLNGRSTVEVGLELLSKLQREFGFESLIFVVPGLDRSFDEYRHQAVHDRLAQTLRSFPDLQSIDLLPDLAQREPHARLLATDGFHPNPRGHAMIAELLQREIRKRWMDESNPGNVEP